MDRKVLQALSFEDGYDRLEEVIQRLEDSALSMEESVALFEEGMQLAAHCSHKLDDAELKVTELLSAASEDAAPAAASQEGVEPR